MSEPATPVEPKSLTSGECVRRVAKLLAQLESSGLCNDSSQPLALDTVEHILITDKWTCRSCGDTDVGTCPHTGRPHRRYLVRIAQDILRLIGAKAGQFVVRPPRLSNCMDGRSRLRSLRRVTMNPQALLLAYYYAVPACGEVNSLVTECAQHFLLMLGQLGQCGAQAEVSEEYAEVLLSSTTLMWREYSRRIAEDLDPSKVPNSNTCRETLLSVTKETYLAVMRELRKSPSNEHLTAFLQLLRMRLKHMILQEDLDELEASDQQQQRNDKEGHAGGGSQEESSRNVVSLLQSSAPPVLLSEGNTSGSDVEAPSPVAIGPPLPPNWYVDENGRSRPPLVTEEQRRREAFARMEFRARKAYETVIKVPERRDDSIQREVITALNDAQLKLLAEQCNQQPPDLRSVPSFLNLVVEGLLNALPRRLRSRVEQEVRDVLDWRVVRRSVMGSPVNISVLTRYVMGMVAQYGAPAKADETMNLAEQISCNLETCTPDLGTAVAGAFRVMFSSIRQLHEDVAHYSLLYIAPQLRDNAVPFMREFIVGCLPPVGKWESSLAFVRKYLNDERVMAWMISPVAASLVVATEGARRFRGSLIFGLIDLLRSSGCRPAERWHDYPTECFFFEKPVVFFAANTVQECALLLLLSGTVSTILRPKGMDSSTVSGVLKQLHEKFRSLLSEQLTLSHLKVAAANLVNDVLVGTKPEYVLSDADVQELHVAVERMTDTDSALYATFERRIVLFIEALLAHGEKDPAPLGLVTESLRQVAALLQRALTLNWEVYRLIYDEMLLHIKQQDTPA